MREKRHFLLFTVLVIGIALVVLPFALSLPSKAATGQRMMDNFRPVMHAADAAVTAGAVWDGLVDAGFVAQANEALGTRAPRLSQALGHAYATLKGPAQQFVGPRLSALEAASADFDKLGGLAGLRLLTWMFVVPGAALVLLAGLPLAAGLVRRATN